MSVTFIAEGIQDREAVAALRDGRWSDDLVGLIGEETTMFKVNGIEMTFVEFVLLLRQVKSPPAAGRRAHAQQLDSDARLFAAIRAQLAAVRQAA